MEATSPRSPGIPPETVNLQLIRITDNLRRFSSMVRAVGANLELFISLRFSEFGLKYEGSVKCPKVRTY